MNERAISPLAVGATLGALLSGTALTVIAAHFGARGPIVLIVLPFIFALLAGIVNTPRLATAAVFALFPAAAVILPSSSMRIAILAILALVMLGRITTGQAPLTWTPELGWLVAIFAWMLVAIGTSVDANLSVKEIIALLSGIAVVAIVVSVCRDLDDARWVLGAFLVSAIAVALEAQGHTSGPLQAEGGGTTVFGRLTGYFGSPNQLGSFSALASFVAVGLAFGARTRRGRLLAAAALPLLLLDLTLSLSRGAWIGAILGFAFLMLRLREARRALVIVAIPLIALAVASGAFRSGGTQVDVVTKRVSRITVTSPYDFRSQIWHEAIREIKASPWRGEGPGSFPTASQRSASSANTVYAAHAHNIWLTWGAENGLPAVGLLVAFMLALGVGAAKASRAARSIGDRRDVALIVGAQAALLSVLGQGLVDYTLRNAVVFASVATIAGVILVARREATAAMRLAPAVDVAESKYDRAVSERTLEDHERRLAEQAEALHVRRERLAALRLELEERERRLAAREASIDSETADAEAQKAREREQHLAQRERRLAFREAALEARELEVAAAAPAAAPPQFVPEPEPVVVAPEPVVVAPEPVVVAPEPEPVVAEPQPVAAGPTEYGEFNLVHLEHLVDANADAHPERVDEWRYYLFYLRGYADVDERLPRQFDSLVADVFGDLLD